MKILRRIGIWTIRRFTHLRLVCSVIAAVFFLAVQKRYWPRTVRAVFMKQIVFTGFDALSLILLVGVLAGISVVTQAQLWLGKFGQIEMLGPLLVAVIVREAGPLLVNFAVIGRSGTAIAAELASMRVRGEIDLLDAQGVDPMVYLVMPRVLSIAISVLSLTVVFVVASFGSGYLFGLPIGVSAGDPSVFVRTVLQAVTTKDIANLLAKTIIPGLVSGAICCVEGLSAHGSATEIPQATARAVVRSIASVLFVSALISVLTYA